MYNTIHTMLVLLIITMVTLLTILVHHTHTHPHINTFFKPNDFCENLLTWTFPEKSSCCWWWWHISDNFSSMSREEEFRSVPRASRGKRSVEMRAQKQVVSGQSVKSNAISVVWEQPKMLLPMLSLMFLFPVSRKPMLRYETYTRRQCSVR